MIETIEDEINGLELVKANIEDIYKNSKDKYNSNYNVDQIRWFINKALKDRYAEIGEQRIKGKT